MLVSFLYDTRVRVTLTRILQRSEAAIACASDRDLIALLPVSQFLSAAVYRYRYVSRGRQS